MRTSFPTLTVIAGLIAAIAMACDATAPAATEPAPATQAPATQAPAPSPARWSTTTFAYPFDATLPEGWEVTDDSSGIVSMSPTAETGLVVEIMSDLQVMARDCDLAPEAGAGSAAADIVAAVAASEGLEASEPMPVTIGGWSGLQVDFALADGGSGTCTLEDGTAAVPLLGVQSDVGWLYNAAGPAEDYRYVVLDAPGGGTVIISMYAIDPAPIADLLDVAMPMIDGLTFDTGS